MKTIMWPMRRIKVFLASSIELQEERDAVELCLRRMNDEFLDRNVVFVIVRWEQESMTLHDPRAQDRYNEELEKCDALVALFGTRVGSYTKEELQLAIDRFQNGQLPRKILVCFRNENKPSKEWDQGLRDVLELREGLKQLEQVYAYYDTSVELADSIIAPEARRWVRELASTTDLFRITDAMLNREVNKMPRDVVAGERVLRQREVRALCKRIGLFRSFRVNSHLAFDDGDVAWFDRLTVSACELEATLRARSLILQQADKLGIRIWRQGQLSAHSQEIEVLLTDRWSDGVVARRAGRSRTKRRR